MNEGFRHFLANGGELNLDQTGCEQDESDQQIKGTTYKYLDVPHMITPPTTWHPDHAPGSGVKLQTIKPQKKLISYGLVLKLTLLLRNRNT